MTTTPTGPALQDPRSFARRKSPPERSRFTRGVARGLGAMMLAGALAFGTVPAAQAGPDDGRYVATRGHVDSPKTFWRDGRFVLFNEAGGLRPLDETVNWVGKGWGSRGRSQYTFELSDSPSLKHLGEPGDVWYRAPGLPWGNQDPIWAGFGADRDIPAETFRDGTFSLDLLEIKGPGRMEMFNYFDGEYPTDLSPLFSSFRDGWKSSLLRPGSHTHNETVFSKPGRYELTYRTVARGTDGSVITSEPSKMVWQVGGARPLNAATPSTRERYDAAPSGDVEATGYRFSSAPKAERVDDGDEHLTTLTFDAGDESVEGTLTVFIDGHFLTDLPVREGQAVWDEMLGSEDSRLQAVFTPSGEGNAQPGEVAPVRWLSPELEHRMGGTASVSSAEGEGAWPEPSEVPQHQQLSTGTYAPESTGYRVEARGVEIEGQEYLRVEVVFDDPRVRAFIRGGLYETPESVGPDAALESNTDGGRAVMMQELDSWLEGTTVRLQVLPHPEMNLKGFSVDLPQTLTSGYEFTGYGAVERAEGGSSTVEALPKDALKPEPVEGAPLPGEPEPEPSEPAPSDPAPAPPAPSEPDHPGPVKCIAPDLAGRTVLNEGHVDLLAGMDEDGSGLSIGLKDDTGLIDRASTVRSLNEVVLGVGENAREHRTGKLMDPALDFLGAEGDEFYGLPMTQQQGRIWPGYNTSEVDYSRIEGPVTLRLKPVQMPEDATFALYQQDPFGSPAVLMDSSAGREAIEIGYPTHVHANWVFTKPGLYRFQASYEAVDRDGRALSSPVQDFVFAVGDEGEAACLTDGHEAAPTPAPSDPAPSDPAPSPGQPAPSEPGRPDPSASDVPTPSASASDAADPGVADPGTSDSAAPGSGGDADDGSVGKADGTGSGQDSGPGVGGSGAGAGDAAAAGSGLGGVSGGVGPAQSSGQAATQGSGQDAKLAHTGVSAGPLLATGAGLLVLGAVSLGVMRGRRGVVHRTR